MQKSHVYYIYTYIYIQIEWHTESIVKKKGNWEEWKIFHAIYRTGMQIHPNYENSCLVSLTWPQRQNQHNGYAECKKKAAK